MLDRRRGQDPRAPGGVMGIQRARKMHPAPGGRALSGDDAIANNGQCLGRGIPAGNLGGLDRADWLGDVGGRGRHGDSSHFLVLGQHFHAGVNDWLTIRNCGREFFTEWPISR